MGDKGLEDFLGELEEFLRAEMFGVFGVHLLVLFIQHRLLSHEHLQIHAKNPKSLIIDIHGHGGAILQTAHKIIKNNKNKLLI